jgi:hypothetical protein
MRRYAIAALLTAFAGVAAAAENQPPPPPNGGHQCERTKGEAQTS